MPVFQLAAVNVDAHVFLNLFFVYILWIVKKYEHEQSNIGDIKT